MEPSVDNNVVVVDNTVVVVDNTVIVVDSVVVEDSVFVLLYWSLTFSFFLVLPRYRYIDQNSDNIVRIL
jgi:hypothetical protein